MNYLFFKRSFDFISASLLFVFILPLYGILALLIRVKLGSPIYFTQERSGLHGKSFRIKKFRTMVDARDQDGQLLPDEQRVTAFGKWLRSSSLDELPELLCIIRGEMSVIGPRPLPPIYNEYYSENEKKRFLVRSGLIPPEVLYHDIEPTWDNQLTYEADYAEKVSFSLDCRIMFTVFTGLFSRYNNAYGGFVRRSFIEERNKNK